MKRKIIMSLTILFSVIFGMMGFSMLVPLKADAEDKIFNTTANIWWMDSSYDLTYLIQGETTADVTWELLLNDVVIWDLAEVSGTHQIDTTGLTAGTYVLRLTAHFTDADKMAEDGDMNITIKPGEEDFILNTTTTTTWGINTTYNLTYTIDQGSETTAPVTWELWQGVSKVRTITGTGILQIDTTGLTAGTYTLKLTANFTGGDKLAENGDLTITVTPITYQARVNVNAVAPSPIDGSISTPFKVGYFTFSYDIIKINGLDFNDEIHSKPSSSSVSYNYSTNVGGNFQPASGPVFLDTNLTSSQTYIVELNLVGQLFYTSFKVEYHEVESFEISLSQTSTVFKDNIVIVFDDILYSNGASLPAQSDPWKYVDTDKIYTMDIGGQKASFVLGEALTNGQISFQQSLAVKAGYSAQAYSGETSMSNSVIFAIIYSPVNPEQVLIGGYGTYDTVMLALQTSPIDNVVRDDKFFYKNQIDLSIRINDSADPNTLRKLFFSIDGGATFSPADTMFKPMKGDVTYVMKAEVGEGGSVVTKYWAFECVYKTLNPSDFKLIYNNQSMYTLKAKSPGAQKTVLTITYVLTPGVNDDKTPIIKYGLTSPRSDGITFGTIYKDEHKFIVTLSAPLEANSYSFYLEWPPTGGVGQVITSSAFTLIVETNDKQIGGKDPMNQFLQFVLIAAGAVAVIIVGSVVYDKWLKQYITKRFRKDAGKESDEK